MKINMNTYTPGGDTGTEGFEPLPAGTYTVKIDGLEKRTSQNKNEYYSVTLIVAAVGTVLFGIYPQPLFEQAQAVTGTFSAVIESVSIR